MPRHAWLPALVFSAVSVSCSGNESAFRTQPGTFVVEGVMEYLPIETGCWILQGTDGTRYQPAGEDLGILWRDGLRVTLLVKPMPGVASICQAGEVVEVVQILKTEEP